MDTLMTAKNDQIGAVDRYVGYRVQLRRICSGMDRDDIAGQLGISAEALEDYERGRRGLTAGGLYCLCSVMGVPLSYFFDGLCVPDSEVRAVETISDREELDLLRTYSAIADPRLRKQVRDMARGLRDAPKAA